MDGNDGHIIRKFTLQTVTNQNGEELLRIEANIKPVVFAKTTGIQYRQRRSNKLICFEISTGRNISRVRVLGRPVTAKNVDMYPITDEYVVQNPSQ